TVRAGSKFLCRPVFVTSSASRLTVPPARSAGPSCARSCPTSALRYVPHRRLVHRRGVAAKPEEELALAGGAPASAAAGAPAPPPPGPGGRPRAVKHGSGPQRRAPSHPAGTDPVPSDLELRLDHRDEVTAGRGAGRQGGQHQPQRDERQVGHGQIDRATDGFTDEGTDIGALQDTYPLVGTQRPGELPVPDVDSHHLGGTR